MDLPEDKPKRRWFPFSLRTLFVVVTLSAVLFAWVGSKITQGRKERAVIAWMQQWGGYAYNEERETATTGSIWPANITRIHLVPGINLSNLSPLTNLTNLTSLKLNHTKVSDISPLAEFSKLRLLWLHNSPVSDLSPLAALKKIESLHLSGTLVSDLSPLAELERLKELDLSNTQVSDLSPLIELNNLKELDIDSTLVSEEEVQMFRQALPDCRIVHPIPQKYDELNW